CARDQVLERGLHRERVGVVAVVDEQAAAGQLDLLTAPARERDLDRPYHREPESPGRTERSECVARLMACAEIELDLGSLEGDQRSPVLDPSLGLTEADDLEVGSRHGEVFRYDRGAAGGQGRDQLALRLDDVVERPDELEVGRPDVRDDSEVGSGDRAELGDLAQTAHRQLDDADLRNGLEPAERQWYAELVVVARLRGDGMR